VNDKLFLLFTINGLITRGVYRNTSFHFQMGLTDTFFLAYNRVRIYNGRICVKPVLTMNMMRKTRSITALRPWMRTITDALWRAGTRSALITGTEMSIWW